ncbi:hypothetical protein JXB11_04085 [Candidatus Woesearchaeota archaeon]|nr:hypothetical protein [Candidatus Woesearchaeota archaeon]
MESENYYFIRCGMEDVRFSELEQILEGYVQENKIELQYSFPYIATVAAKIEEKSVVEELVGKGYAVEPQNILRQLDTEEL